MSKVLFEAPTVTTLDEFHGELDLMLMVIEDRIEDMAVEAEQALDDMVDLMNLRADYEWFRAQVLWVFPAGPMVWIDEALIRKWAHMEGLNHIADAIIDELSPKGAGIAPDRRN